MGFKYTLNKEYADEDMEMVRQVAIAYINERLKHIRDKLDKYIQFDGQGERCEAYEYIFDPFDIWEENTKKENTQ